MRLRMLQSRKLGDKNLICDVNKMKRDMKSEKAGVTGWFFDAIEGLLRRVIKRRENLQKQRLRDESDIEGFAELHKMSSEEYVEKVERYNRKDPGRYAKLLKYDTSKSPWSKFL